MTLYTQPAWVRNRNRVVKLNERKIRYIVREKIKNRSNKRIAAEMKVSVSTVALMYSAT